MTIAIHWDKKWGGFYIHKGYAFRLCLGYFAITIVPIAFDKLLKGQTSTYKAMRLANNALYFADSSDYLCYLWQILESLDPKMVKAHRDDLKLDFIEE